MDTNPMRNLNKLLAELREDYSAKKIRKMADGLSYVRVHTPLEDSKSDEERELELTPDEIYALKTYGYVRDTEDPIPTENRLPPALPNEDNDTSHYQGGPGGMDTVYNDRLNSDERFEDLARKQALDGQRALNKNLDRAEKKIKHQSKQAQRKAELDAAREEMNKEIKAKALNSWADAAAGWISKAKR